MTDFEILSRIREGNKVGQYNFSSQISNYGNLLSELKERGYILYEPFTAPNTIRITEEGEAYLKSHRKNTVQNTVNTAPIKIPKPISLYSRWVNLFPDKYIGWIIIGIVATVISGLILTKLL